MAERDARFRPVSTAEHPRISVDEVLAQRLRERDELARLEIARLERDVARSLEVDRGARSRSPPPHRPHPLLPRVKIVTNPNGETVTTIY